MYLLTTLDPTCLMGEGRANASGPEDRRIRVETWCWVYWSSRPVNLGNSTCDRRSKHYAPVANGPLVFLVHDIPYHDVLLIVRHINQERRPIFNVSIHLRARLLVLFLCLVVIPDGSYYVDCETATWTTCSCNIEHSPGSHWFVPGRSGQSCGSRRFASGNFAFHARCARPPTCMTCDLRDTQYCQTRTDTNTPARLSSGTDRSNNANCSSATFVSASTDLRLSPASPMDASIRPSSFYE